jgi:hypothetical protein
MRNHKLRSGVDWQGALKKACIKQGLGVLQYSRVQGALQCKNQYVREQQSFKKCNSLSMLPARSKIKPQTQRLRMCCVIRTLAFIMGQC